MIFFACLLHIHAGCVPLSYHMVSGIIIGYYHLKKGGRQAPVAN